MRSNLQNPNNTNDTSARLRVVTIIRPKVILRVRLRVIENIPTHTANVTTRATSNTGTHNKTSIWRDEMLTCIRIDMYTDDTSYKVGAVAMSNTIDIT